MNKRNETMASVAVVIPAYNAASTVEDTVRNVMSSTIPLEVWVVNDGSTDDTGKILDRLAEEFSVNVIHQENQGAYAARLNALKRINTPWFGFVDADDMVEPTMFEELLAFAESNQCDAVQCGVKDINPDVELGPWYREILNGNDSAILKNRQEVETRFIQPHLVAGQGSSFIWNKLYLNQYDFNSFATFNHLTNYDDMIFNFEFFASVSRFGILKKELYHYARTSDSATHSFGECHFRDFMACYDFRRNNGVPSRRWYWVNLRSAVATVIRSNIPIMSKVRWIFKFLMTSI